MIEITSLLPRPLPAFRRLQVKVWIVMELRGRNCCFWVTKKVLLFSNFRREEGGADGGLVMG